MVYKKNASTLSLESIRFSEGMYLKNESGFQINFFFKDHLASVRAMVDPATQQIREQNDFYPFGERFNSTPQYAFNPSNRYRYNEKEIQTIGNLGYIDYGWRMADPIAGRWISIDPLAEKYYSISPYAFTGNNPVMLIDPDGRDVYRYDDKTGKMVMFLQTNDDFDQIGRFKYDKKTDTYTLRTNRHGKARTRMDNVEKGILSDGMNFMTNDNMWAIGGEGQPTVDGFQNFAIGFSEMINKEVSGYYMSQLRTPDVVSHIYMGRHIYNTATSATKGGAREINRMTLEGTAQVHTDWHTHPSYGHSIADRTRPSGLNDGRGDIGAKRNALRSPHPLQKPFYFMILTRGYAPIYY